MQIFINELSLVGQYFTDQEFTDAVKVFTDIFSTIEQKIKEKQIYKDGFFLNRKAILDKGFQESFQQIRKKDLKIHLRNVIFNRLNVRDWQRERLHSSEDWFQWEYEVVTDTSIAELAERKMRDVGLLGMLVNFQKSRFAKFSSITIKKNESTQVDVDCIEPQNALKIWLERNLHLSLYEYDPASTEPPTDLQTVLRDTNRFKRTSSVNQGRKVYQEIQTGYYWCVDNSPYHIGKKAHLEVFDSQKKHIGEASLDGQIDYTKKEPGRTL